MELIKKTIRSYRTIAISEPEEMFEHSIIVPDSKPDVKDILLVDAEGFVLSTEKTGHIIEVSGEIQYRILYIPDTPEPGIESISARYPWSFSIKKPEGRDESGLFARCRTQHSEAQIVNGRKLVCRTVTSLPYRFYEIKSDDIGREIAGENIFLKTNTVNIITFRDYSHADAKVSDILSLPKGSPPIKEVLFSRINLSHTELSLIDEDPVLEGKGALYLLYRSDSMDESIESVVLEFPVKTPVGVEMVSNEMVFTTSIPKNWEMSLVEDDDGLYTKVSIDMDVEVEAQSVSREEEVIIDDAYSTDHQLTLNKSTLSFVSDEKEFSDICEIRHRLNLGITGDHLSEVLMVCANERNIASKISDKNINVQGTVGVDILYCTHNKEIMSRAVELPFNLQFVLPDNHSWQMTQPFFTIENIVFDIASTNDIELAIKLHIKVHTAKHMEISCAAGLEATPDTPVKKAPVILYFTKPGETLWDIAKHYRIPVEKLISDNSLSPDAKPEPGKRLFIMG
jgi:LysM repeat protein